MRLLLLALVCWLLYRLVTKTMAAQRLAAERLAAERRQALGPDPHEVLGVRRTAGPDEIRAAYRALAKKHHPDVAPPDQRPAAEERMRRIQQAYDALVKR